MMEKWSLPFPAHTAVRVGGQRASPFSLPLVSVASDPQQWPLAPSPSKLALLAASSLSPSLSASSSSDSPVPPQGAGSWAGRNGPEGWGPPVSASGCSFRKACLLEALLPAGAHGGTEQMSLYGNPWGHVHNQGTPAPEAQE